MRKQCMFKKEPSTIIPNAGQCQKCLPTNLQYQPPKATTEARKKFSALSTFKFTPKKRGLAWWMRLNIGDIGGEKGSSDGS